MKEVIENQNGETIGFTYSYDFFQYDNHCKMALCLFDKYQNKGYGVIAALKMLDYLFSIYPLNQVFTTVFDYNKNSLNLNMKGGFKEAGVLPNYIFYKGAYHNLHYLYIKRGNFEKKKEHYSKLIKSC